MKFFIKFVSLLALCLTANAVNRCHYLYEERAEESLIETIKKIIEELEISKTSSFALVLVDLRQSIEEVLQELSYILDLFVLIDEKDVDLTTKDAKKFQDINVSYSKSLQNLQAWNKANSNNRRKRQTDGSGALSPFLGDLTAINYDLLKTMQEGLKTQDPALYFCPVCGSLKPLNAVNNPRYPATPGLFSGFNVDGSEIFPGVAYLPSCGGNRPARISAQAAFAPCALQEQIGSYGLYFCFHPALYWARTEMSIAFKTPGAVKVTKDSGDIFLVARFNYTKDGLTYSTIGYYFIYDYSIEFWDGSQAIRSTNYLDSFDILACSLNSNIPPPAPTKRPCRWSETVITDANGNYLKTACIIPLAHTKEQASFYCNSIGWQLYNIQSEDERSKLSAFVLGVQPGIYNIDGKMAFDGIWYCGDAECYSPPTTTGQWPEVSCMAFSFDGYQNHYVISSDCNKNKFYSICQ